MLSKEEFKEKISKNFNGLSETGHIKLPFNEIQENLLHHPNNRCFLTSKEDTQNIFIPTEHQDFEKRYDKTKKDIKKNGYNDKMTPIKFAHCYENDEFYRTDGEGTIKALSELKEDKEFNFPELITCVYEGSESLEGIGKLISFHNGEKPVTKWKERDKVAVQIRGIGGKAEKVFKEMSEFQLTYNTVPTATEYIVYDRYLQGDCDVKKNIDVFTKSPTIRLMCYKEFLDRCGKPLVNKELLSENKKKEGGVSFVGRYNLVRTERIAWDLSLYFRAIEKTIDKCLSNLYEKEKNRIYTEAMNSLINQINKICTKAEIFSTLMYLPKRDKYIFYNKLNVAKLIYDAVKEYHVQKTLVEVSVYSTFFNSNK